MRIVAIIVACVSFGVSTSASAQIVPDTAAPEATSGNPSVAPFKWSGLLVIPQNDSGSISECTGEFIAPNVVLTAGHCLKNLPSNPTGPWPDATKGTFWLQYQNQTGVPFKIVCAAANPRWWLPDDFASMDDAGQVAAMLKAFEHDYAMLLVDGASPTGTMPYALDWKGQYTHAARIGYPGDILDGTIVQKAPGVVFFADAIPIGAYASPNLVMQWGPITDATEGMSGGAWVAHPDAREDSGKNVLIAVTSFGPKTSTGRPMFPGGTFAAYLRAAEFKPLLTYVQNGCK